MDNEYGQSACDIVQGGQTHFLMEGVTAFLNCVLASCKGAYNDSVVVWSR
jgi:hypothetical protein